MMEESKPQVVIIGAGIAGLAAAVTLVEAGMFHVVVMEATSRPGGRIHTLHQMGTGVIELGATWIHGEGTNPVYLLAKDHGQLQSQDSKSESSSNDRIIHGSVTPESNVILNNWVSWSSKDQIYILEDGTVLPETIVERVMMWFNDLIIASRDPSTHAEVSDIGSYLTNGLEKCIQDHVDTEEERRLHRWMGRWLLRAECVDCACRSVHDLSLPRYNDFDFFPGDFYCSLGRDGYQGIVDILLAKLPEGTISYSSPVTRIVREESNPNSSHQHPIAVHTSGLKADVMRADHVIITASLGYLKENQNDMFQPPLPVDLQQAIKTIGFGTVNKIFLKFDEPFWHDQEEKSLYLLWEQDSYHDPGASKTDYDSRKNNPRDIPSDIMRRIIGFEAVEGHGDVLCAWISGKEAEYMEQLPDDEVEKMCSDILCKFLKRAIPKPIQTVVTRWHSRPFIRGSYSTPLPVHCTGNEYDTMTCPVYSAHRTAEGSITQIPRLMFAGEGCTKKYNSTTHGAMVTGQQQAETIIQFSSAMAKTSK